MGRILARQLSVVVEEWGVDVERVEDWQASEKVPAGTPVESSTSPHTVLLRVAGWSNTLSTLSVTVDE